MMEFCENKVKCRRTILLHHFGQQFDEHECNQMGAGCDNCCSPTMVSE